MFNSVSMVLLADRDHFSNSTLSLGLRKLGLARNVICTTSSSAALAYLHKQRANCYPFPEIILFNPNNSDMKPEEFLDICRANFREECNSKIVILEDKEGCHWTNSRKDDLIAGKLRKPVTTGQLLRLFSEEGIRQAIG